MRSTLTIKVYLCLFLSVLIRGSLCAQTFEADAWGGCSGASANYYFGFNYGSIISTSWDIYPADAGSIYAGGTSGSVTWYKDGTITINYELYDYEYGYISNSWSINFDVWDSQPGIILSSGSQTLCAPASGSFSITGNGWPVIWQQCSSGCSPYDDTGWTTTGSSFSNLMQTTSFRAKSTFAECGSGYGYSNTITINVLPALNPGLIAPSRPGNFCPGELVHIVNQFSASGGQGTISYKWQNYTGNGYVDIANSTEADLYLYNTTDHTYTVRRGAKTQCNTDWAYTHPVSVTVQTPTGPTVATINIPYNTSATLTATGAQAGETYKWYNQSGNSIGCTGNGCQTPVLSGSSQYVYYASRLNLQTGCETPAAQRTLFYINLYIDPPPAPTISTNTCGPKIITLPAPPSGTRWVWVGNSPNSTWLQGFFEPNPANPNTVTFSFPGWGTGPYYIRGVVLNNNGTPIVWSPAREVSAASAKVNPVDITTSSYDPSNTLLQATHRITIKPGFIVGSGNTFKARIAITSECSDFYNWTEEIAYGQNGEQISRSKMYLNGIGSEMQTQSIDYQSGKVWVAQPVYDFFNRPTVSTLPAPIQEHDFIFKNSFVSAGPEDPYDGYDFDDPWTTLNDPLPVGTEPGSLGWYYSANNNLEPWTPTTSYPYERVYSSPGPDPSSFTSSGVGDTHKMGSGHEVKSERLVIGAELNHYLSLRQHFVNSSLLIKGHKYISTDPDGKKSVTFVDADGRTLASATLTGTTYDNWSYSYYNDLGQLIASVAPMGVVINNPDMPGFVTRYAYDHLGRLIETTSPDEGLSEFVYNTDGMIRFSRNTEQRSATPKRFSYSNYDVLDRLIETGEYVSDETLSGTNYVFEPHSTEIPAANSIVGTSPDILDATGFTLISYVNQPARCRDYTLIDHDVPFADCPGGAAAQTYVNGRISRSRNAEATTWYSYDEFGQVIKTWQTISSMPGTVTISYTYDYFGNVTQVLYQRGQDDTFYHHYEYDANNRLFNVSTSLDGVSKTLRASYTYYLHGPLKRVELGNKLQGIDYVYNIDGSLKLINHPDPNLDPGTDGISGPHSAFMKDVFGEALDYHANDYSGAALNEGTLTTSAPYTDKFSGVVKAVRWHSHTDNHVPRVYAFTYDNLNQMDNADWGTMTGNVGGGYGISIDPANAYREDVGSYDKNGNIQSLVRKGKTGNDIANYDYQYVAGTNRLGQVTTGADNLSYQYNAIGQMTQQTEGAKTMKMSYNVQGLVKEVRDGNNKLVLTYQYDDRGNRIAKTQYDPAPASNPAVKTTFYIHDASGNVLAIYEKISTTVTLAEVPIYGGGRVAIYKPGVATTFYEVADHLGNVRGVIGVSEVDVYSTNFETPGNSAFQHYSRHDDDLMDHTDPASAYTYSQILTGGHNSQIGLTKSLKVSPGDTIRVEAYGKYRNLTNNDVNLGTFASALTSAFGVGAGTPGDPGNAYGALEDYGNLVAGGYDHSDDGQAPKAYLNILLFDNNHQLVDAAYRQIAATATQSGTTLKAAHDPMMEEVIVTEPGYAYVFFSNENLKQVDVYFDDVTITHSHSPIVAGGDFYPFGLAMEDRQVTDESYRYEYQGQFSEKDLTTGMHEFELRMYDARIGRWTTPDPYGQFASPYLAMANQPHMMVDPDGGCVPTPCIQLMEVVIEGSRIASTVVLPVLSNFATTTASISQHVGNRLANGAVKTGNDIKNAYLNSGYFANSALHAITFGTWQKWEPGSLQQEYLQSAGQGFGEGVLVAESISGGMTPRPSPVLATSTGSIPITQPLTVTLPTVLDVHGQLNAEQTQTNSKTLWKGKGKERIDVENPNPGQRSGQIHYQDNAGNKYIYDYYTGQFRGAPNSVNKLLKDANIREAIKKGLKYLGLEGPVQ